MKTTTTITLDADIKKKALDIIQNEMDSSLSQQVNKLLKKIIEEHKK